MIERQLYMSLFDGKTVDRDKLGRFEPTVEQLFKSGNIIEQLTLFTGNEVTLFKYKPKEFEE